LPSPLPHERDQSGLFFLVCFMKGTNEKARLICCGPGLVRLYYATEDNTSVRTLNTSQTEVFDTIANLGKFFFFSFFVTYINDFLSSYSFIYLTIRYTYLVYRYGHMCVLYCSLKVYFGLSSFSDVFPGILF